MAAAAIARVPDDDTPPHPRMASVTPLASRRAITEQPPRPRGRKAWTLMLVPPVSGGRVRTVHVRKWQARLLWTGLTTLVVGGALFGFGAGARLGSEPFAALDAELADAEMRAAALADTLRALRIAATSLPAAGQASAEPAIALPVQGGRLASRFSRARMHPILRIWRPHLGLDIAAPRGTRITAPAHGRVRYVGRQLAAGLVVELDHGSGIITRYLHLRSALVEEGDQVTAGTTIATVGSSGLSTGSHLHYEVRLNGRAVDPLRHRLVMPEPPKPVPPVQVVETK
jgi:murein DD-endopeptidase MepM/ murein hydrolase activator NlpD